MKFKEKCIPELEIEPRIAFSASAQPTELQTNSKFELQLGKTLHLTDVSKYILTLRSVGKLKNLVNSEKKEILCLSASEKKPFTF